MPYKTTTGTTENLSEFLDDQIGLQLASVALLGLAMIPICTGSFSSLRRMKNRSFLASRSSSSTSRSRSSSRIRSTIRVTNAFEDTDDEEGEEKSQILTIKDAFLFPIIASGLVYAVYLTINEVKPVYVHQAIRVITSILYCAVFSNTSILVAKNKLPSQLINQIEKYKFSFSARDRKLYHINITIVHVLVFIVSVALAVTYALTQHWIIGNLFAVCLAIDAIGLFTVDSFSTGFLLLLGMLAYDVFWLFDTDIMLSISNLLEHAPTSIIWPRNINTYVFHKLIKSNQYFTMFGLGDIIVPGIFIAYCLRFDKLNSIKKSASLLKRNKVDLTSNDFKKPYFISAMVAYGISAGASIYTVHFTKRAQSALLFIVPALILSTLITALVRNELWAIYNYHGMLKTINKLSSFSADEEEESDDERPIRFQKSVAATRGGRSTSKSTSDKSTSATARGTSKTRGTSVSRGASRSKSKSTSRSQSKPRASKKNVAATVEKVVAEAVKKSTRKRRSTSKAAAQEANKKE